jgi:NAD(P)-dependent dehydrogenase (short-subunit alcohol dehydrogenase family)
MNKGRLSAIIIAISSDIGTAMARRWLGYGWKVFGTCRTELQTIKELHGGTTVKSYIHVRIVSYGELLAVEHSTPG